jgi:undecaprenyl pyrophosphate synthase
MENKDDQKLREWIVEKVLDYHKGHQADSKRIRQDCEALYEFIIKYVR